MKKPIEEMNKKELQEELERAYEKIRGLVGVTARLQKITKDQQKKIAFLKSLDKSKEL